MSAVREHHGMCCSVCGDDLRIDIAATVWIRLTPDGTDATEAANGDHEWSDHSTGECQTCNFVGHVSDFSEAGGTP